MKIVAILVFAMASTRIAVGLYGWIVTGRTTWSEAVATCILNGMVLAVAGRIMLLW